MALKVSRTGENLTETVVEARIIPNPDKARDLWAGILSPNFEQLGFTYIPVPQLNLVQQDRTAIKFTLDNDNTNSSLNLFVNEQMGVRFVINGLIVSFNCAQGKYLGWEEYRKVLIDVLSVFMKLDIAKSFERLMIRYISEYDFNILDKVKIEVNPHADCEYQTSEISLSRSDNNIDSYITISGLKERVSKNKKEKRVTSLFDVNVFERLKDNATSIEDVCISLDNIHEIEKKSFFGLLKEDFIETIYLDNE